MKKGDIVITPNGKGVVEYKEFYSRISADNERICVKLDNNPFSFPVACYWVSEIKNTIKLKSINEDSFYCADYESDLKWNVKGAKRCNEQCDYCVYNNR